jgi:hypothetical protein
LQRRPSRLHAVAAARRTLTRPRWVKGVGDWSIDEHKRLWRGLVVFAPANT